MTQTRINKIVALVIMAAMGFMFIVPIAHANPLRFVPQASTATATSTLTYMTAGTATTTVSIDSFANGQTAAFDRAALLTQFTASSTSSVLGIQLEYSQDGIDWYADNLNELATTSTANNISVASTYSWTFASTTPGAGAIGNSNLSNKIILIEIPARFVRAIYTLTGTNGAVWGSILPLRQSN